VSEQRRLDILARHSASVVSDTNELVSAFLDKNVDARRTCVERILDELFDNRRWALDYFTRGDLVGDGARKHRNNCQATSPCR
jgi:hypothetical protein